MSEQLDSIVSSASRVYKNGESSSERVFDQLDFEIGNLLSPPQRL